VIDLGDTKYYFDGVLASYVALRLEPTLKKKFSGIELEILEKIYNSFHTLGKTISTKAIAEIERIPESSAEYVVNALFQKGFIQHGSDWKTTDSGDKIISEAISIYKESKEFLQSDRLMSTIAEISKTRIVH